MTTSKITEREILNSIIDGTADPDVLVEYAEKRIGQLDKRNASAQKRAAQKRAESDELTEAAFAVLTSEPMNREEIVEKLIAQGIELTPNKVTARMTKLYKDGRIQKDKVRVKGEDGKSRESTVYFVD